MKLSKIFSDNMIIQQNMPFKVWGFDATGRIIATLTEKYTGKIYKSASVTFNDNSFILSFPSFMGSFNTYTLNLSDSINSIEIKDIRFGDVYLMAGQSNMAYCLSSVENSDEYISQANSSDKIVYLNMTERHFTTLNEVTRPNKPQKDLLVNYKWKRGIEGDTENVSAISIMLAVNLSKLVNYPIGFIHTAMGGLSIDSYLPKDEIDKCQKVKNFLIDINKYIEKEEDYNSFDNSNFTQMSGIFNEKISPLKNYNFKAIIWYLGESSAYNFKYANGFNLELELLIKSYRKFFGYEIPVIASHIALENYPYGDKNGYIYINEAINLACSLPKTYAIPVYDIEPRWLILNKELFYHPIHTVNKLPVINRITEVIYKNLIINEYFSFPSIDKIEYFEKKAICSFKNVGKGLRIKKSIFGFTIAGKDGRYNVAKARVIDKNKVELYCEDVKNPTDVTYAFFQYNYYANLTTINNLPVQPFRTKIEDINKKGYYFSPLYTIFEVNKVLENNFGYEVGNTHYVPLYSSGSINLRGNVKLKLQTKIKYYGNKSLQIISNSKNSSYFYFGISPKICLCGHKHHLENFDYLSIQIQNTSSKELEFHGLQAKLYDGSIIKFGIMEGENLIEQINIYGEFKKYVINLLKYYNGDEGIYLVDKELKKGICEIEFVFRCKENCILYMDDIQLFNNYVAPDLKKVKQNYNIEKRQDCIMPTNL